MRIAHILRKYHPAEWGGTETAVKRLLDGLRAHQAEVIVYCPDCQRTGSDPLEEAGHPVERYRAFLPVWGLGPEQKRQLVAVGGNLMSFDLIWKLQWAPGLSVIHTHALNRLGGIAAAIARVRRIPFVVSIHGGVLDLPEAVKRKLLEPLRGGVEWGKVFGWILRSRRVLDQADAIVTCNRTEAALLKEKFPDKIIYPQPHGVPAAQFLRDQRPAAREAFPQIIGQKLLLVLGRLDPVKNQSWLVQQLPEALRRHPDLHLLLAGACTDEAYGKLVETEIHRLGLEHRVTIAGGLPQADPRLIGLLQEAALLIVPSLSETFGLVILEAWAAGTPVMATRTSGASELVRARENGWFFDLEDPSSFHRTLAEVLEDPEQARRLAAAGQQRVRAEFDDTVLAGRLKHLYEELIGEA
ncbi:MAG: glycosyltransferase family 4 protein [Verrucomicrobiota bacterium]